MPKKQSIDDDESSTGKKRVTRTRSVVKQTKYRAKKNKPLPKVKFSVFAQMASLEKEMMDEYHENEEKKKNITQKLKVKKDKV